MIVQPSPIQAINSPFLAERNIRLLLKRDDLLHPHISGNKWRKLKYNIKFFKENNFKRLLTFGGAFSNHIAALAAAGNAYNFETIGIIRGECPKKLNPTLAFAAEQGMHLKYISRSEYQHKYDPTFQEKLLCEFGNCYILPEGGTNALAIKGCQEIIEETKVQLQKMPDLICICFGTGGSISGIITALAGNKKIMGFSALKGNWMEREVTNLLQQYNYPNYNNWRINSDFHFGGYAKWQAELVDFINQFKQEHQIQLDPIYTGKMMYGIFDLIEQNQIEPNSTILAIHSGGLQGIKGFNQRFGNLIEVD